ncbi:hypothetical protein C3H65_03100 [Campylobacter jejuni]|nr:hypothetical protein C3H65_03100 [Campylobacter jejuni]
MGIQWNDKFSIGANQNQSIDLIGIELQNRLNSLGLGGYHNSNSILNFTIKHFQNKNICFIPEKNTT